jgi:hypothetical protein
MPKVKKRHIANEDPKNMVVQLRGKIPNPYYEKSSSPNSNAR